MNGPFSRQGPAATLRQHCTHMTQRRCIVAGEATDAGGAMDGDGGANVKIGNPLPMKLGQQLGLGL